MPTVSIILPAHNEAQGLRGTLQGILAQRTPILQTVPGVTDLEIIVVDDGSRDGTASVLADYPKVKLVRHEDPRGYGAALKTGFAQAVGEYLCFLDADNTYPPEWIAPLCRTLVTHHADVVVGSRLQGRPSGMPWLRLAGNRFFARLLSWMTRQRVSDATSGMRVLRRAVWPHLSPLPDGLHFTPAMSARALHEHLKVVEVAIPYHERVGRSKLRWCRDGLRFLSCLVHLSLTYNPLRIYGTVGLSCLGVALVLAGKPLLVYLERHVVPEDMIYRLLTVVVAVLMGLHLLSVGIVATYVATGLHQRPVAKGRATRWLYDRRAVQAVRPLSASLILGGVLLNIPAIAQYLQRGAIDVHWSYLLVGALCILTGVQLFVLSLLVTTVSLLVERLRVVPPPSA